MTHGSVPAALVSCIVPVFNGEPYLREALDSILQQTYGPLQVIVADDGSTDGSATVVASYGEQIHYLRQANAGPSAARNLGLGAARGDFIAFLDADDLWLADKLAKQTARFAARPDLEMSVTYLQNFWIPELAHEAEALRGDRLTQPLPGYAMDTLLARRRVFETVGLLNTALRHGEDTEWFLRASECGVVTELLPDVLCRRRMHHHNLTRRTAAERDADLLRNVKAHLERGRRRQ